VTNQLLAVGTEQPLSIVAEQALAAAEADFATLVLPRGDAEVIVAAGAGGLATELVGRTTPLGDSLSGQAIRTGKATLVTDHHGDSLSDLALDIGPQIVVPLTAGHHARGALILGRLGGRTPFTADLTMAASYAVQAVVALELVDSRDAHLQLSRMEDRDRIAADLHDHVIQELFAVGMGLQGLVSITEKPSHVARILEYINPIDQIISSIRTTIFDASRLDRPFGPQGADPRHRPPTQCPARIQPEPPLRRPARCRRHRRPGRRHSGRHPGGDVELRPTCPRDTPGHLHRSDQLPAPGRDHRQRPRYGDLEPLQRSQQDAPPG